METRAKTFKYLFDNFLQIGVSEASLAPFWKVEFEISLFVMLHKRKSIIWSMILLVLRRFYLLLQLFSISEIQKFIFVKVVCFWEFRPFCWWEFFLSLQISSISFTFFESRVK